MKLSIRLDLGASLTKSAYQWVMGSHASAPQYKTFCSAVQRITSTEYERGQYADNNTSLLSIGDEYWSAGENARDPVTNVNLRQPKCRNAIAKILAVVGQVIAENVPVDSQSELHIDLGVLLPLNEMGVPLSCPAV
ncbi:MAG: hypothetical protein HC852_20555 [Acaryochloridaceae cyanobacterium RU_4_10]|nr:hypothetical protein [Acaryochloridaceae cyanobacterium RU_4_10]